MLKRTSCFRALLLAGALSGAVIFTGCAGTVGVGYRAYDPYYRDYHPWDPAEAGYYNQWIIETRRPHKDYRHLKRNDQRAYWDWRHKHQDHH